MIKSLIQRYAHSDFYEVLRHFKNYFSANVANKALSLISVPIFTRLLTKEDYGILSVYASAIGILVVLMTLNSSDAISRYYYEFKPDFKRFVSSSLIFTNVVFFVSSLIVLFARGWLAEVLGLPEIFILFVVMACFFANLNKVFSQLLLPKKKSKEYSKVNISQAYVTFAVTALMLFLLPDDRYMTYVMTGLAVTAAFSIYFIREIAKNFELAFSWAHARYIAVFSIPLIPYSLSGIILQQFDRIMIKSYVDMAATGVYSLGYNFGMLVALIATSFNTAFMPDLYGLMGKKQYFRIEKIWEKIFKIVASISLLLVLFSKEILMVLADSKFLEAYTVVGPVVIGYVFFQMFSVYGVIFGYEKRTFYSSSILLACGAVNIILNALYIPVYGYIASAYITTASYFLMFALSYLTAKYIIRARVTGLEYIVRPVGLLLFFASFHYYLGSMGLSIVSEIPLKISLLGLFIWVIYYRELKKLRRRRRLYA